MSDSWLKIKKKIGQPIPLALLLNVFFVLLSIFIFHPHFETNDDAIMAMIAEGAYGASSPFLVNIHYFIGILLQGLYQINAVVRWYSVLLYILSFTSFSIITYLILKHATGKVGKCLSLLFLLCFFYEGYVLLQYTKVAAFLTIEGFLLLLEGLRENRKRTVLLGMLTALVGSLVRFPGFLIALAFASLLALWELWIQRLDSDIIKKMLQYLSCFLLVLLVSIGLKEVNTAIYSANGAWGEYLSFHHLREQVLDYNRLNWDANQVAYENAGISENDIYSYNTWQFAAPDVFNASLMNELIDIAGSPKINVDFLKGLADMFFQVIYRLSGYVIGFCALAAFWFIYMQKKKLPLMLVGLMAMAAVHAYYFYIGRWTFRTVTIVWFAVFVILMYAFESREEYLKPILLLLVLCVINTCGLFLEDSFVYHEQERMYAQDIRDFYAEVSQDKEHLYLIDTFSDKSSYEYSVFTPCDEGCYSNVVSFGSWLVNSPIYNEVLQSYGVTNPYLASFENQNVYIVDREHINNKLLFLSEHYDILAEETLVSEKNGFQIYKLTQKKD